jgi:hypothetical protein
LNKKTILRGGYGLNYYALHAGSISAMRNPPFVSLLQIDTTPTTSANRLRDGLPPPVAVPAARPTGNLTVVSQDVVNPYVHQYNLTLQRQLLGGLVLTSGYVGVLGRKQYFSVNINLPDPGRGAVQPRRPFVSLFPDVQNIGMAGSWGTTNYHALQTTIEKRYASGWNFQANYTWAHNIDNYPVIGGGKPGSGPFPQLGSNRRLERGNSDLDIRQRLALLVNYELPGNRLKGMARVLLQGWQANGILLLQTGPFITITNNTPQANTGSGDRPNVLRNPNMEASQRSLNRWFDTAAFAVQPQFSIGNVGRNTLLAPGRQQLDFSIFKNFTLKEKTTLQFRAEMFNITNTPNFGVPANALGAPTFGIISDTGTTLPRNVQLALKLRF